jgi:hypothetical protein
MTSAEQCGQDVDGLVRGWLCGGPSAAEAGWFRAAAFESEGARFAKSSYSRIFIFCSLPVFSGRPRNDATDSVY